jgi:hypothetical protein
MAANRVFVGNLALMVIGILITMPSLVNGVKIIGLQAGRIRECWKVTRSTYSSEV